MENNVDIDEKQKIQGIFPVLIVGAVSLLSILITYIIISTNPLANYKTVVFIVLLIIMALGITTARKVENSTIKSIIYLVAGFATFWTVGAAYHSSYMHLNIIYEANPPYFKLFNTDFIPVSLFAIANAITVLVALIDGRKNGSIFGSMGFGIIIFSIASRGLGYVDSKIDVLLLLIVLWALIPTTWIRLLGDRVDEVTLTFGKRFFSVLKVALLTVPIYIVIGLLTFFVLTGSSTSLETFSLALFISNYKTQLIFFALSAGYFYLLPNVIIVVSTFFIYEFGLHAMNLNKVIAGDGAIKYLQKKKKTTEVAKKEYDPFENVIKEMQDFKKEFGKGKVNRLIATQKIGTFKEQVDFLRSKYDIGSKPQASDLLKQIERETEFAFK